MAGSAKTKKTRPDLDGKAWLNWLAEQPENAGIDVKALCRKMLEWCEKRKQQPTRRRLLKWIESTRESVPMDLDDKPPCDECGDTGRVRGNLETWPCPECRPDAYSHWLKQRGR